MIITLLRKPLEGSVVENTLKNGCVVYIYRPH